MLALLEKLELALRVMVPPPQCKEHSIVALPKHNHTFLAVWLGDSHRRKFFLSSTFILCQTG